MRPQTSLKIFLFLLLFAVLAGQALATTTVSYSGEIRELPQYWRCLETLVMNTPWYNDMLLADFFPDTLRNTSRDHQIARDLDIRCTRGDANMELNSLWNNGTKVLTFETLTGAGNIFRNINAIANGTEFVIGNGSGNLSGRQIFTFEQAPNAMLRVNASCNASGSIASCAPWNWTEWGESTVTWLNRVAPDSKYRAGSIVAACENEPYNSGFLFANLPDGNGGADDYSAANVLRRNVTIEGCRDWTRAVRAGRPDVLIASPSFTTALTCCGRGEVMLHSYLGNSTGTDWEPDFIDVHLYVYTENTTFADFYLRYTQAYNILKQYGMEDKMIVTETNWERARVANQPANTSRAQYTSFATTTYLLAAADLGVQAIAAWPATCSSNSTGAPGTLLTNRCLEEQARAWENTDGVTLFAAYDVLNYTAPSLQNMGSNVTVINFSTNNSFHIIRGFKANDTYMRLFVSNVNNSTATFGSLNLASLGEIVDVTEYWNGTGVTHTNETVSIPSLSGFGMGWYVVTFEEDEPPVPPPPPSFTVLVQNGLIRLRNGLVLVINR